MVKVGNGGNLGIVGNIYSRMIPREIRAGFSSLYQMYVMPTHLSSVTN